MQIVRHRVNTLTELASLPDGLGAELDLRSWQGELVLHHEPFAPGDLFSHFVGRWAEGSPRGTLIVNPKEDGLETRAIELLTRGGVEDYFFLDLSLPTTVRLAVREGFSRLAVRFSEYEPAEAALRFAGLAQWVWLDSFEGRPIPLETVRRLGAHVRCCLVSPELEGHPPERIAALRHLAPHVDAVCTKHPSLWRAGGSGA